MENGPGFCGFDRDHPSNRWISVDSKKFMRDRTFDVEYGA